MIYIAVLIGMLLITLVVAPFFVGQGGLLAAGSSISSPERLKSLKDAILARFLEDEAAFKNGTLSRLGWDRRKAFLTHRYVDASRRLDFLDNVGGGKS